MLRPLLALDPLPSKLTLPPAVTVSADAAMLATGVTAVTLTVLLALDCWPRLSVTVSCTVKLPLPLPLVATLTLGPLGAEVMAASAAPLLIVHW